MAAERFYLKVIAPFAAFRGMQAGVYRSSAPTIPPSAALGLVFNLAGIETRDPTPSPTTLMRKDLPRLGLAIGTLSERVNRSTIYQQLHSYPVGNAGKDHKPRTHGGKYWIAPVRREVLVDLKILIGVETTDLELLSRVRRGLMGELGEDRYGLPFAGDNNLLFDSIELLDAPEPARWYTPLQEEEGPRQGSWRLTVGIDRQDNSRTTSLLMAPLAEPQKDPPKEAWIRTP